MYQAILVYGAAILVSCCGAPVTSQDVEVVVPNGRTVILACRSNDKNHLFDYWKLATNDIVGPYNQYNESKYNYEILTGNLTIRHVSTEESGTYSCVSRGVRDDNVNTRSVRMIVHEDWEEMYETNRYINSVRIIVVVTVALVMIVGGYLVYKKWIGKHRLAEMLEDSEDDSVEEVFSAPSTSKATGNIILVKKKAKSNSSDKLLDTEIVDMLKEDKKLEPSKRIY